MRLILSILVLLTNIKCNKKDSIDDRKTDTSNDKQKKERLILYYLLKI